MTHYIKTAVRIRATAVFIIPISTHYMLFTNYEAAVEQVARHSP
jgi:hypothetical protein